MPVYFAWFTTALLSVGGDANDQNLPQSGRLLYCVGRGFLDIYPTFCRINRGLFELATARKLARQLNTSAFVRTHLASLAKRRERAYYSHRPFTAVTRVQIPSGTPRFERTYTKPSFPTGQIGA